MRRRQQKAGTLDQISELVTRLLHEHKVLKTQNARLTKEVDRLSAGWDDIKRLARIGPRRRNKNKNK
jgi:hypothetical protein